MESKGQHSQTPYKALKENPSCYIDPEHLPAHINLANPCSMKCKEIVSFFKHIIQRQQILDPPSVFCFKTINITRKGTHILEDMDADKSTNDEGDQDVNISADVLPPPRLYIQSQKGKHQTIWLLIRMLTFYPHLHIHIQNQKGKHWTIWLPIRIGLVLMGHHPLETLSQMTWLTLCYGNNPKSNRLTSKLRFPWIPDIYR